jgi:hypothetical protein
MGPMPEPPAAILRLDSLLAQAAITHEVIFEMRLVRTWQEQDVLDPKAAETTLAELEAELARIEPETFPLLGRQREIAARLRSMREP